MTPQSATLHALDRYHEHHPEAEEQDLLQAVEWSEEVDTALARTMLGRAADRDRWNKDDVYMLAPDRRGLFVVVHGRTVLTYLRFGESQEEFARRNWPIKGDAPPKPVEVPAITAAPPGPPSWETAALLATVRSPPDNRSYECAVSELMTRVVPVIGVKASQLRVSPTAVKVFGNRVLAKAGLFDAQMRRESTGRVACGFADGHRGALVRLDKHMWTLLLDD